MNNICFKNYFYLNYYNCFLLKKYIENEQNNKIKKIIKIGNINKIKMIEILIKYKEIIKITNETLIKFYKKTNNKKINEIIDKYVKLKKKKKYVEKPKTVIIINGMYLGKSGLARRVLDMYPEIPVARIKSIDQFY